jgi:DNA-binding CsgD family transcriptional regulator
MLLAIAYRPDDLAADHARALAIAAIERERLDRIVLDRLTFGDVAALLHRAAPGVPKTTLRRIYDLSEGRPYIVEELARSVVERGPNVELATTLSLRSAVLERAERLAPADREIIDRAAVLGRNFVPEDLAGLGVTDGALLGALRAGVDLQLLEERPAPDLPSFRFRHALTREILYRNLLALERRALHLDIANRLAAADHRLAECAYHLSAAGDAARAAVANEKAADRAASVLAFADAANLYARALDFTSDMSDVARLAFKHARTMARIGDIDALLSLGTAYAERLAPAGHENDALRILCVVIRGVSMFRMDRISSLAEKANALLRADTPAADRFELEICNAMVLRFTDRNDEALLACERAQRCLASPTEEQRSAALHQLAVCSFIAGRVRQALDILEERIRVQQGTGTLQEIWTVVALACVYRSAGRTRESFEYFAAAAALCERAGYEGEARVHFCNAAGVAAELGDFAYVLGIAERMRRENAEHYQFLDMGLLIVARATGQDPGPFLEMFERTTDAATPAHVIYGALAANLPYMVDVRARARAIAVRALREKEMPGEYLVLTILDVGTDEDVAAALKKFQNDPPHTEKHAEMLRRGLIQARLAEREHRTIEARQRARALIELAKEVADWRFLAMTYEIAGDVPAARAVLLRVGATAELARLDRRHPPRLAAEESDAFARLTRREEQIARAYASGLSSRDVGERLAIGPRTVEAHLGKIYQKLGVGSRAELAAILGNEPAGRPRRSG